MVQTLLEKGYEAYNAPFLLKNIKPGARIFPTLVPIQSRTIPESIIKSESFGKN